MIFESIPNATVARQAINSGAFAAAQKQAEEISAKLLQAIKEGKSSVNGDGYILPSVKLKLEELGYKCDSWSARNEEGWSVTIP